jgi:hypothetical protein
MFPITIAQSPLEALIHGLQTGQWQGFLEWLTEDVTIWFPNPPFQGINHGKERAIALLQSVEWETQTAIAIEHVTCNGTTVMLELRLSQPDSPLSGFERAAISFEMKGNKVAAIVPYLLLTHPAKRE